MKLVKRLLYNRDTIKTEALLTPIKDLGLQIRRSILETCVDRALDDLRAFGIELEPSFYLSDGYGCLEGATTIALGFWDADPIIREILRETKDIFRDEKEILRLIKHEVGHAFCYAHKLYRFKEFRDTFHVEGNFFTSYPKDDRYRWDPWSTDYVNPEGDFYAQKHPDDDFAETFATFVDPTESWRMWYRPRTGAYRKIQFVRRVIRTHGRKKANALADGKTLHLPLEQMKQTVAEFFKISPRRYLYYADGYFDPELKAIFRSPGRIKKPTLPSWMLVNRYRLFIEKAVNGQSKTKDPTVSRELIKKVFSRLKVLNLVYREDEEQKTLALLTSFILAKTLTYTLYNTFKLPNR